MIPDRRVHNGPIRVFSLAGIRKLANFLTSLGAHTWAYVTAFNPGSRQLPMTRTIDAIFSWSREWLPWD
jgi:hypothetical protein